MKTLTPNSTKMFDRQGQIVGLANGVAIKAEVREISSTNNLCIGVVRYGARKYTVSLLKRDCWIECKAHHQRNGVVLHNSRVDKSKDYYNRNSLRSALHPHRRLERAQSEFSMAKLTTLISNLP